MSNIQDNATSLSWLLVRALEIVSTVQLVILRLMVDDFVNSYYRDGLHTLNINSHRFLLALPVREAALSFDRMDFS